VQGQQRSLHEIRQQLYENIIEEAMFISRASEGAVTLDWIMEQPVFVRQKYVESFKEEMEERKQKLKASK